jgi:Cyclin
MAEHEPPHVVVEDPDDETPPRVPYLSAGIPDHSSNSHPASPIFLKKHFNDANIHDIIHLVADAIEFFLEDYTGTQKSVTLDPAHCPQNRFYLATIPKISLLHYLQRFEKYASSEAAIYLLFYVYMRRVQRTNPHFSISPHCIHRFCITCLCVASKLFSDEYYTNTYYARVGGISRPIELNLLELDLVCLLEWSLLVDETSLLAVYHDLITQVPGYQLE